MSRRSGAVSEETKESILKAAADEFEVSGFQGTSLRKISSAAGVTTGAIYFFFSGKDDLFGSVISGVLEPLMDYMKEHYAGESGYLEKDEAENADDDAEAAEFLIDSYVGNRQVWRIILRHMDHPAVKEFTDYFTEMSTDHYMEMLRLAGRAAGGQDCSGEDGSECSGVRRFSMYQFVRMQIDVMMSLVSGDFERQEMTYYMDTAMRMLRGAFYALMEGGCYAEQ